MGYLKSFSSTAGQNSVQVRIDRDAHTLLVRRRSRFPLAGKLRTNAPEVVSASIRNHSGRLEDQIKRATLGDLAAFAQYGKGPILEVVGLDARGVTAAKDATLLRQSTNHPGEIAVVQDVNQYVSLFPIKLTADGVCVAVGTDDDYVFQFESMPLDCEYDFFALEGQWTGSNILYYDTINILQDQREKVLDVDYMVGLVFPATDSFTRLLLNFKNSRTAKYSMSELKYLSAQANIEELRSTSYAGGSSGPILTTVVNDGPFTSEVLVMPLKELVTMELDTDGAPLRFLSVFNRARLQ